ncbi:MAG TPA: AAA family ATPase [Alphaproteobacteria bacterium]|nr:AAA family ATPase [Alphaproteobacteria bacterium]
MSYFNLKEEPFRLTPDPKFLHLAEPHRNALTTLLQGVVYRKGLIVVNGPVGTGKTTLIHAALQMLNQRFFPGDKLLSAFLVNPTLSREEFLEYMLQEFEISCPVTTKPRRLLALYEAFLAKQKIGGTSVLLVDEAHLLSPELLEEIRLLSNADTYREKLLQIVLVGQSELLPLLQRPELAALRQRIASRCQLRSLSLPETRAYIAERLLCAGLAKSGPFTARALAEIFRFSAGVPRLINLICDNALCMAFESHRATVEPDIVLAVSDSLGLQPLEIPAAETERKPQTPEPAPLRHKPGATAAEIISEALRQGRHYR